MRSLTLDFLHPRPRAHWLSWLLLASGIGLAAWAGWQNHQLDLAIATEEAQTSASRADRQPRLPARGGKRLAENAEAQSAKDQLALPWGRLLAGLESVQSRDIALLSLEADGRKTEASVTAEARNLQDMLGYIERLKQRGGFQSIVLASHQLREEDPQQPVRFVLRLAWRS